MKLFVCCCVSMMFLGYHGSYSQCVIVKRLVDLDFQGACSIYVADINNDGHKDILGTASGSDQVAWWESNGSFPPQFIKHLIDSAFVRAIYLYAGDINGDSAMDVVGAARNSKISDQKRLGKWI